MATKVFMEALSPTMEEGRLVKWLRNEGDAVRSGDVIAEVETDKAVMDLVARGDGVLRKRFIAEGSTAPVGTVVGVIAGPTEDIAELLAGAGTIAPAAPSPPPATATSPTASPAAVVDGGRSSPLARRLAREGRLDLSTVRGTGPGGRIVKRDVETALRSPRVAAATAAASPGIVTTGADFEDIPLTQIRKTIARRLAESIGPIPTFYLTAEFDVTRVVEMRAALAELGDEHKVSVNDIVLKAVATALTVHPECNAHWLGDRIRYFRRVHLGMAVATDDGLIVPVLFDADRKRLKALSAEARALAARARERKLAPEEYTGSTFSVSNLGMFGIDQFTAIINPPECGILAVGAIEEKPVLLGGAQAWRKLMRVTMSCDHRVIDGATGARFLQTLRRMLDNPLEMI